MGVERKFVRSGLDRAQIAEFFAKQLERAGYGGMNINRTPMGTQVTIFAEKPGMIIGKGGRTIHKLTSDLETVFHIDNPQIDVQEVKIPELNAQMMASRLAGAIERGLYFRKAGHNMLRRIMDAGALGCEIDISGKLTGPRKRTEKFVAGNMLHAGNPAERLVDDGFAIAIKKLGVIGCRVRIVPPNIKLPGRFKITQGAAEAVTEEAKPKGMEKLVTAEEAPVKPATTDVRPPAPKAPKGAVPAEGKTHEAPGANVPTEAVREEVRPEENVPEKEESSVPLPESTAADIEERMQGDVLEHKHPEYNYWHPASRVHKKEEN